VQRHLLQIIIFVQNNLLRIMVVVSECPVQSNFSLFQSVDFHLRLNSLQQIAAAIATFNDSGLFSAKEKDGINSLWVTNLVTASEIPFPSFPKIIIPFL